MRLLSSRHAFSVALLLAAPIAAVVVAHAAASLVVAHGSTQTISAFNECRKVANNSPTGLSVYVPTHSAAEWQSFRSHPPSGIALTDCAAVLGDHVYLFGGYGPSGFSDVIYRAPRSDPTSWSDTGAKLPSALAYSQTAIIGDYVYLFGGGNMSGTRNTIYRAPVSDPTNWTNTGKTLPGNLDMSQLAVIGDYVYLFGGYGTFDFSDVIYRAPLSDPTSWVDTRAKLPSQLAASSLAVIGDHVYLFGGYNNGYTGEALDVIYRAPLADPTFWTDTGAKLPSKLAASTLAVIGGHVYLFGSGTIYRAPLSDPTSWVDTHAAVPAGLSNSQTAVIGDYVYLFGGYEGWAWTYTDAIYRAPVSNPTDWEDTGATLPSALGNAQTALIDDDEGVSLITGVAGDLSPLHHHTWLPGTKLTGINSMGVSGLCMPMSLHWAPPLARAGLA